MPGTQLNCLWMPHTMGAQTDYMLRDSYKNESENHLQHEGMNGFGRTSQNADWPKERGVAW